LPPVIATLLGDDAEGLAKIAEFKAALEDLGKTPTVVPITADTADAIAQIAELKADAHTFGEISLPLSISDADVLQELVWQSKLLGEIADSMPISIPVQADMGPAVAEFAAGAAAMRATADAVGGGAGGGGLLGLLGWGGGSFGMASFGSVLSLAGFGFEHLMTTALGLAGSLSGALLGGITLVSGALATMGVGELTDISGMGQAIGDIKQYTQLSGNLAQAIAVYGKSSTEAGLAQYQMNQWLQDLAPATVAAIKAAANTAAAFHAMFDSATADAETTGAQIINAAMLIGEKFLPTIGKYAAENLGVIKEDLSPLFTWLGTTGLQLFQQVEQQFSNDLPAAMGAFDNGVELVIKFLAYASQMSGHFVDTLDKFFTKWNSASMTSTWEEHVDKLIGLFHTWWDLLKQVGLTIYDVFSKSVGLGTAIVKIVTSMLTELDKWIQSTTGTSSVHTLFAAHLAEIKQILAVLPALLSDFGRLYLMIAPDLTDIVTGLVSVVSWMLAIPGAGPILGWVLAIGYLAKLMGLFTFARWVGGLITLGSAFVTFAGEEGIAAAASATLGAAMDLIPIFALITGIALLVTGIVLLITHFKQVSSFLSGPLGTAISIAVAVFMPLIGIPMLLIGHWQQVVSFFKQLPGWIMDAIKALPGMVLKFFEGLPGDVVYGWTKGLPAMAKLFMDLGKTLLGWIGDAAVWLVKTGLSVVGGLLSGLVGAIPNVLKFFIELPFWILAQVVGAAWWLIKTGQHIIEGLLGGIIQVAPTVSNWFLHLPTWILQHLVGAAVWLFKTGISILSGLLGGIGSAAPSMWTWFTQLPSHILGYFATAAEWLFDVGKSILQGLWNGIKSVWNSLTGWLGGIGKDIVGFFTSALGIHSPSTVMHDVGQNVMLGLQMGLASGVDGVMGVMAGTAAKLKGAISASTLAISGSASATILHSLAAPQGSSTPPLLLGSSSSALAGNQTLTVPIELNVTVPGGTPASVAQQIGAQTQEAVNQAVYKAVRQLKGGARSLGFMPT
jgi:hypothetical protein